LLLNFRPQKVEITNPSILLPNLPEAFSGYRIVQVSDFHLGTWLDSHRSVIFTLEPGWIHTTC